MDLKRRTKIYENLILNLIGVLFLGLGIAAILNSLHIRNPMQVFWMCYLSLLLMGIGILTRNPFLVMSQVYILAIPVFIWDIDFLYQLIIGQPLFGLTDYFFYERALNLGKVISLQHLFSVPLAIYSVYIIGRKRNDAWKWSFIQITLIYLAVTLFTAREKNINCVFDPCINFYSGLPYRLTWFIIFFTMTFITALVINNLPFLKVKK